MLRSKRFISLAACLPAVLLLASCNSTGAKAASGSGGGSGGGRGGAQPAVSVATAPVQVQDVPVYLTALGNVVAYNTVVVRSRIDGQLIEVPIREGQEVRQGQLLAQIDPRPYQVQLSQAQANLYRDQAALRDARLNAERYSDLAREGVISKQQYDTQAATSSQFEGAVKADEAAIDNAKLNLVYTRITAPISGRVGLRQVDPGNMVHATDQNGLLIITQLEPIAILFTLPADQLPSVAGHMKNGTLTVAAYSRDDQTRLGTGVLLTIDNQIDPTTGTGRLKAQFDNKDRMLWPNQFVNVRLLLEVRKNSTVVPAAAIQRGPHGTYVYVAKADNTAELRPVTVALMSGDNAALSDGLKPGEIVVTDGQDKLQSGSKIELRSGGSNRQQGGSSGAPQATGGGRHQEQQPAGVPTR